MAATQSRKGGIEVRSIDYVPLNERHGKVWHLGPLWFMSNAQIATLAVGLISISEGASLFWSVLAIVVGVGDRRRLDDDRRLGPGCLGRLELRRHRHRGT